MDHANALAAAMTLAMEYAGTRIILKDIPQQLVHERFWIIDEYLWTTKYDNESTITLHTLPF